MPTIPGHATEIRYRRTGPLAGKYYHRFSPGVRMAANADGSVTLRGRRRIHARDDEPGFWQRYGGHRANPGAVPLHAARCPLPRCPTGTHWEKSGRRWRPALCERHTDMVKRAARAYFEHHPKRNPPGPVAFHGYLITPHGFGRKGFFITKGSTTIQRHVNTMREAETIVRMLAGWRNPRRSRPAPRSRSTRETSGSPWPWIFAGVFLWVWSVNRAQEPAAAGDMVPTSVSMSDVVRGMQAEAEALAATAEAGGTSYTSLSDWIRSSGVSTVISEIGWPL